MTESLTGTPWNEYAPGSRDFLVKTVRRGQKIVTTHICKNWISLDTETAHNHNEENPVGWIYQWAFKFGDDIVIGRRPSEFVAALESIKEVLEISPAKQLFVFVHNLSYDISYLWPYLEYAFGKHKMLAVKPHKFISFEVGGFVFRCTYKLSNKSLNTWSSDLGTTHRKLAEEKAYYDEIHYQDEELSAENWAYQIRDVVVLDEAVEKQMEAYNDTLLTLPLTSTGYVRRDARRNYKKDRKNRKRFIGSALNPKTYAGCREEFAGGLTHGNRFKAGKTVRPETKKGEFIRHRDFRSHYPSQQRCRKFPLGPFILYDKHLGVDDLRELSKEYCVLMKVNFDGAALRQSEVLPTMSASKAYKGRIGQIHITEDNGRVLDLTGKFSLWLTELDFDLLTRQYDFGGYDIEEAYIARKGFLPLYMKETVDAYFLGKTKWKAEKREAEEAGDEEARILWLALELMKSKNGLNGIYGMTATDIVRTLYKMDEKGEWSEETPDVEKALKKYYGSENSFNRYQWGIYTTSWARHELLEYAWIIQRNGGTVLYADTDSIFYVSNKGVEDAIEAENARRKAHSEEIGAYIDYNGKRVTYDSFDDEGEDITAFRFLHAKCYAYETRQKDGTTKLHCTIAGVTEFEDATQKYSRVDELGSIDELKKGKVFTRCGGTKSAYPNTPMSTIDINGHVTEVGGGCVITPTTKTLKNELEIYDDILDWEVVS